MDYLRNGDKYLNGRWAEDPDMSWAGEQFKKGAKYILLHCDYEGASFFQIPFDHLPTAKEMKDAIRLSFYGGLSTNSYADTVANEYGFAHLPNEKTFDSRILPKMYKMSILMEYGVNYYVLSKEQDLPEICQHCSIEPICGTLPELMSTPERCERLGRYM